MNDRILRQLIRKTILESIGKQIVLEQETSKKRFPRTNINRGNRLLRNYKNAKGEDKKDIEAKLKDILNNLKIDIGDAENKEDSNYRNQKRFDAAKALMQRLEKEFPAEVENQKVVKKDQPRQDKDNISSNKEIKGAKWLPDKDGKGKWEYRIDPGNKQWYAKKVEDGETFILGYPGADKFDKSAEEWKKKAVSKLNKDFADYAKSIAGDNLYSYNPTAPNKLKPSASNKLKVFEVPKNFLPGTNPVIGGENEFNETLKVLGIKGFLSLFSVAQVTGDQLSGSGNSKQEFYTTLDVILRSISANNRLIVSSSADQAQPNKTTIFRIIALNKISKEFELITTSFKSPKEIKEKEYDNFFKHSNEDFKKLGFNFKAKSN